MQENISQIERQSNRYMACHSGSGAISGYTGGFHVYKIQK